jgi:hypothetical protein
MGHQQSAESSAQPVLLDRRCRGLPEAAAARRGRDEPVLEADATIGNVRVEDPHAAVSNSAERTVAARSAPARRGRPAPGERAVAPPAPLVSQSRHCGVRSPMEGAQAPGPAWTSGSADLGWVAAADYGHVRTAADACCAPHRLRASGPTTPMLVASGHTSSWLDGEPALGERSAGPTPVRRADRDARFQPSGAH